MDHVRLGLLISFVMGLAFVGYTIKDFNDLHFGWRDHAYGSAFYTIVGLHGLHVIVGLAMNVIVQIKAWQNKFSAERHLTVDVFSLYWHFVDAVWLVVFPTLFLSVHIR
jgi:heme/copper-type cytochrome/quinol oxidase subunit 3